MITGLRPTRSESQPATSGPGTLAASRTPYMRPIVPASSPTASARYSGTKMFRTPRPREPPPSTAAA